MRTSTRNFHTITSREFNQHVSRAKRAAKDGPVIITERGKPSYVLMRHEEFARTPVAPKRPQNALEALTHPGIADIDVEFPRIDIELRAVEFD
jgi:prevent-host-death family protein